MLEHLDDLASDFSAIHGIADITTLSGPVFFKLAYRIASYQGVMRDTALASHARERPAPLSQAASAPAVANGSPVEWVPPTKAGLQSAPMFAGVFSFGKAG